MLTGPVRNFISSSNKIWQRRESKRRYLVPMLLFPTHAKQQNYNIEEKKLVQVFKREHRA